MRRMRGLGTCYQPPGTRFYWIQYWHDGQRFRESTGKTKYKEALEMLKQKLAEVQAGAMPSTERSLLVADLYQRMERDYAVNGRKSLPDLKGYWKNHLEKFFARMRAGKLRPDHVDAYVDSRLKEGAANASINRELAALKRMYKLAVKKGVLKFGQQPYIELLDEHNVRKGFVKDQEYEALVRATMAEGLWLRAIFEVGHTYGWRRMEVQDLHVYQLDLLKRTVNLDPGQTKEDDARIVGMTQIVWELLSACCAGKSANDYVFTRDRDRLGRKPKNGGRIVDFRDDWARACCAAGVGKMFCREHDLALDGNSCPACGDRRAEQQKYVGLLFHDLRRTAVSNNVEVMDEKTAMLHSGHKTRSVFDRYHIISRRKMQDAARRMEKANRERVERARFVQGQLFEAGPEVAIEPPKKPAQNESQRKAIAIAPARPN